MPKLQGVKELRAGRTQIEFAADAEISTATLQRAESGAPVDAKTAEKIATELGVTVESITLGRTVTILGYVIHEDQINVLFFTGLQFAKAALHITIEILTNYINRRKT